jgi:hypothetical protein
MTNAVIIPFRDRGTDPLRQLNLACVQYHWVNEHGITPRIVSDGRDGDQQFNRSAAYNHAANTTDADVLVFTEADMLISPRQIREAIALATETVGLVVPFTERHEFGPDDSARIRDHTKQPNQCHAEVVKPKPRRTGAINVLSRDTLNLVGQYDEQFEGSWWDDRSMHIAFDICAGPTRWIDGPAWHLYHLPGYEGEHLTPEDKAATARNRERWQLYTHAQTPDQIRRLTIGP